MKPNQIKIALGICLAFATHQAVALEIIGSGIIPGQGSHQLIYDPVADVTWLDGGVPEGGGWSGSMSFALSMVVNVGGEALGGWKLASPHDYETIYTELGNTPGQFPPTDGPFVDFLPDGYGADGGWKPWAGFWSDTEISADYAKFFDFARGCITGDRKGTMDVFYAMAVHPGRVGVPDLGSTLGLTLLSLAGMALWKGRKA